MDSRSVVKEIEKNLTVKELRESLANIAALRANGIDVDKAIRDAEIVGAINRAMAKPGEPPVVGQDRARYTGARHVAGRPVAINGRRSSG